MESLGVGVGARDAANTSLTSNTWCPMTGHTLHGSYLCMTISPHSSHLLRMVMVSCHNFKCIRRCIKIAHSTKGKKNTLWSFLLKPPGGAIPSDLYLDLHEILIGLLTHSHPQTRYMDNNQGCCFPAR